MTIEEAIAHAKETADTRSDLCDECRDEHRQLADWLTELKQLREETSKLKRLLRLAVNDFEVMGNEIYYKGCDFDFKCKLCPFHCYSGGCSTKWRCAQKALEVLEDEK